MEKFILKPSFQAPERSERLFCCAGSGMTVVAWDGRFVAADSQVSYGSSRGSRPVEKIKRRGSAVYAFTGTAALFEPMIEWEYSGADPNAVPKHADDDNSMLLVWRDGRCWSYTLDTPYADERFAPDAWGVAADHVLGAMDHGISAERAVKKAIEREFYLGGPVMVVDLRPGAIITKKALNGRAPAKAAELDRTSAA